jgi:hypothetical protein
MMNRRTFLCGLTLGMLSLPLAGGAQRHEFVQNRRLAASGWPGDHKQVLR